MRLKVGHLVNLYQAGLVKVIDVNDSWAKVEQCRNKVKTFTTVLGKTVSFEAPGRSWLISNEIDERLILNAKKI